MRLTLTSLNCNLEHWASHRPKPAVGSQFSKEKPMLDRETLLTLFEDTANVLVWNLDFIPDDKLGWQPAPDAK